MFLVIKFNDGVVILECWNFVGKYCIIFINIGIKVILCVENEKLNRKIFFCKKIRFLLFKRIRR